MEIKYTVTVNYEFTWWRWEAAPSVSWEYLSGIAYSFESPSVTYYHTASWTISGTWIESDQTFTVIYEPNNDTNGNDIADEEEYFTIEFTWWTHWILYGTSEYEGWFLWLTMSEAWIIVPEVIAESWYVFSGWNPEISGNTVLTWWIVYTVIYWEDKNYNGENDDFEPKYSLTINYVYSRWWMATWSYTSWDQLSWFRFNVDSPSIQYYQADRTNVSGIMTGDIVETVTYSPINDNNHNGRADEEEQPSSWWNSWWHWGWWWGWWWNSPIQNEEDDCPDWDFSESSYDGSCWTGGTHGSATGEVYLDEMTQAYIWSYDRWITTKNTIQEADMSWNLTRIAMAKMLSYYAINVLWMKPNETRINKFNDVSDELDAEYNSGVTLAYQLWIMWISMPNNNFRPFDLVPRSELVTALSRMIFNTPDWIYEGTDYYYRNHMEKLWKQWIVTVLDPNMMEVRWYLMIMLMRSAGSNNNIPNDVWNMEVEVRNYFSEAYKVWQIYSRIWDLQRLLQYLWFYNWKINNTYDKNTINAVHNFQVAMWILDANDTSTVRWYLWPSTREVLNREWAEYQMIK